MSEITEEVVVEETISTKDSTVESDIDDIDDSGSDPLTTNEEEQPGESKEKVDKTEKTDEPEKAEKKEESAEEAETEEAETEEAETGEDETTYKVKVGDEEVEVPEKEMVDGYLRRKDYSAKTQEVANEKRNLQERSELVDKTVEQVTSHSEFLNMVLGNQDILDVLAEEHGEKVETLISKLKENGVDIEKTKETYTGQVKEITEKFEKSQSSENLLGDIFELMKNEDLKMSDWEEISAAAVEHEKKTGMASTPEEAFDRWNDSKEKKTLESKYEKVAKENEKLKAEAGKKKKPRVPVVPDKTLGPDKLKGAPQKLEGIGIDEIDTSMIDTTKT